MTVSVVSENPMGRALKRGFDLGQFQEQLNSTADLLKNYRECDGKGDAKLIEDIIKDAESCWSGSMAGGKWNQVRSTLSWGRGWFGQDDEHAW